MFVKQPAVLLAFSFLFVAFKGLLGEQCGLGEFPCEDGTCIDEKKWCDEVNNCPDESDEQYCGKNGRYFKAKNHCNTTKYFECSNGPCIPIIGFCNGYASCPDKSDESDCKSAQSEQYISGESFPEASSVQSSGYEKLGDLSLEHAAIGNHAAIADECGFSNSHAERYCLERVQARNWLLSERKEDFGWGEETHRAVMALYMSRVPLKDRDESDMLMEKQLDIRLSIALSRNSTKMLSMTDLSLYINSLTATCRNPRNFHGFDLVSTLRQRTDVAQHGKNFVPPFVYLTLCINNVSTYNDKREIYNFFLTRNKHNRIGMKSLAVLAASCIEKSTEHIKIPSQSVANQFLEQVSHSFVPGNVYEAALFVQALKEMDADKFENIIQEVMDFILEQQHENGSFGNILATYYVLPILSGRSLLSLRDYCDPSSATDLIPIDVLKNTKRKRIFIHYALYYGFPVEVTQTLLMSVPQNTTLFDVMRLAEEINPNFKFQLDNSKSVPSVYSIGGVPNDAEKGLYWTLHIATQHRDSIDRERLQPYTGSIKSLQPNAGDEIVFWRKPIR